MTYETQNTIFPGFDGGMEIKGSVPMLYDASVTGFRAARTTDYGAVNVTSGSFILASNTFTPSITTITGDGNVSAGAHYVEFILSTGFNGIIQSGAFIGSETSSYAFPVLENNTYGIISYSIPSGSAKLIIF